MRNAESPDAAAHSTLRVPHSAFALSPPAGLDPAESNVEVEADALDGAPQCPAAGGLNAECGMRNTESPDAAAHSALRVPHSAFPQFDTGAGHVAAVDDPATDRSGTGLSDTRGFTDPSPASVAAPASQNTAPLRLTEAAIRKGAERARLLRAIRPHAGLPLRELALLTSQSPATLSRLRTQFGHLSDDQLTPENLAARTGHCGRTSRWEVLAAQENVQQRLWQLYLLSCGASSDVMTRGRRTGSMAATLTVFARDALCPPDLAAELRAGKQPLPLVRVIRRMNDLHEQRDRGAKHTSLNGQLIMRRSMIEILEDGTTTPIQPGDWWVFDDMSDNMPHWWTGVDGRPMLARQGLYCFDIAMWGRKRGRWMGVEKVGTARDSYTAAIILRFLRELMTTFGKPRRGVIFERSVWQANAIAGVRLTTGGTVVDEEVDRPAIPETDKALLQKGIEALGLLIHYTHTPRGKEIEGAFNHLQRLKPMVASQRETRNAEGGTGQPVNIGRHAGEYEHAARQMRRARAGSHHPEDLGFLHIDASRDLDLEVMEMINGEERGDYPALAPLTGRDLAVFLPETRQLEIRNGKVTATVDGQPLDFTMPEMFASLGSGYKLALKFDPTEPTIGGAIYNADTSSRNFHAWQPGEFIGWAEFLPLVARMDWRTGDVDDPAGDLRRRHAGQIRTSYGAVGVRRRIKSSTSRDGRGNVAVVSGTRDAEPPNAERGMRNAESVPAPQRRVVLPFYERAMASAAGAETTET